MITEAPTPTPERDLYLPHTLQCINPMTQMGATGGRRPVAYPPLFDDHGVEGYRSAVAFTVTPSVAVVVTLSAWDTYTVERVRTQREQTNHLECPVTWRRSDVYLEELDGAFWEASCYESYPDDLFA